MKKDYLKRQERIYEASESAVAKKNQQSEGESPNGTMSRVPEMNRPGARETSTDHIPFLMVIVVEIDSQLVVLVHVDLKTDVGEAINSEIQQKEG